MERKQTALHLRLVIGVPIARYYAQIPIWADGDWEYDEERSSSNNSRHKIQCLKQDYLPEEPSIIPKCAFPLRRWKVILVGGLSLGLPPAQMRSSDPRFFCSWFRYYRCLRGQCLLPLACRNSSINGRLDCTLVEDETRRGQSFGLFLAEMRTSDPRFFCSWFRYYRCLRGQCLLPLACRNSSINGRLDCTLVEDETRRGSIFRIVPRRDEK